MEETVSDGVSGLAAAGVVAADEVGGAHNWVPGQELCQKENSRSRGFSKESRESKRKVDRGKITT